MDSWTADLEDTYQAEDEITAISPADHTAVHEMVTYMLKDSTRPADYDVQGIVASLIRDAKRGRRDSVAMPDSDKFWDIVARHDRLSVADYEGE